MLIRFKELITRAELQPLHPLHPTQAAFMRLQLPTTVPARHV